MLREQVIQDATNVGLVAEPCRDEGYIAIRCDKAPKGTNERMRITADGAVLTIFDGYYWQVGTIDDVSNYVKTLKTRGENNA